MFKIRTTPVEVGTKPYAWGADVDSKYECTWFCYFRCQEAMAVSPPCWYDGHGSSGYGSYTDAKDWLKCYRDPWVPITDPNYKPVAGDILVYDGEHGHVIFMETDNITSEYRSGDPNSFRNAKLGDYKGVLLGVLHYPYSTVNTVERNEKVNQIQTTDISLRIRTEPSLQGQIVGHVQIGYYNVLSQKENDGYTWYEIEKDRWCANDTVKYLPSEQDDMIELIRKWSESLIEDSKRKTQTISDMEDGYKEIEKIVKRYIA